MCVALKEKWILICNYHAGEMHVLLYSSSLKMVNFCYIQTVNLCACVVYKEDTLHGANDEYVEEKDPPYLPKKQQPQNQLLDLSDNSSGASTSLPEEPLTAGPSPASEKANQDDEVCIFASCYWIGGFANL